jgi:electron transport complex protein RnfG
MLMKAMVKLIGVLTLTCLLSALGLAYVNKLTEEPIAEQKRLAKLRAVNSVLPPFDNDPVKEKKELKIEGKKITFYIGKKEGKIVGVAFLQEGEGYGGFIKVMLGITPEGEIGGVEILEHLETPGLGARIEEPQFKEKFKGKSLANSKLAKGKLAVTKDGGDIDALTGATISPRGVVSAVNKGLKIFKEHREKILGK